MIDRGSDRCFSIPGFDFFFSIEFTKESTIFRALDLLSATQSVTNENFLKDCNSRKIEEKKSISSDILFTRDGRTIFMRPINKSRTRLFLSNLLIFKIQEKIDLFQFGVFFFFN